MNDCEMLKDIVYMMASGADPEECIPLDLSAFSNECRIEIAALYISHGKDENRKEICRRLINACRTDCGI